MGADVEDYGNGPRLIARGVVNITVGSILIKHVSFASLPHHRKGVVSGNGQLTNLAPDPVLGPVGEPSLMVHVELEVNQSLAYFGVDERHLVSAQILNEVCGGLRVKPEVGISLVIDNSRRDVMDGGRVASDVVDSTITCGTALEFYVFQLMLSQYTEGKRHAVLSIKGFEGHAKYLTDTWKSVSNCPFDWVRIESIILRERWARNLSASL